MPGAPTARVLGGIDRAAFAAALGARLRRAGVPVEVGRLESLSRALQAVRLLTRGDLYWSARITLVRHRRELEAFDAVFAAVFEDAILAIDPHARRDWPLLAPNFGDSWNRAPGSAPRASVEQNGAGLPWATRPSMRADDESDTAGTTLIDDPLPSAVEQLADTPFEELDPEQLHVLSQWLRDALASWPTRRTRRTRPHRQGRRIDLRATLSRGRATAWEPIHLIRRRPVHARRRIVLLCDVSRSMQPYTVVYLQLMRAAALTAQAEVFAFSTGLTRLTPTLRDHSDRTGAVAIARAAASVSDRSGGTRIGHCLRAFLLSRHGNVARGAIVVIASDGWDADDPAELDAAIRRLHRRARRVIWLNPRAATPGFEPLTGAMSVALPFCDDLLPGHTLRALQDVVAAITRVR